MKRPHFTASLVLLAGLLGCATPEQMAQRQANQAAQQEAYFAALRVKCERYGFLPGTNGFAQCVRQEDLCERRKLSAQADFYANLSRQTGPSLTENMNKALEQTNTNGLCR